MLIAIDELKQYLRVDYPDDDMLLEKLEQTAEMLCADIVRLKSEERIQEDSVYKTAVLYAAAYLYENRDKADHNVLNLTLRALLFGVRNEEF